MLSQTRPIPRSPDGDNNDKVMRRLEEGRKAKESSRKDDCKIIEVRRREGGNREKETTSKRGEARIEVKDKSRGRSRWEQRSSTYSLQKTSSDEAQKPGDCREERQRNNNKGTIGVEDEEGMKRVPYLQVSKLG